MKKLIIFDFDGTLMDTIIDAGRCFNKTLEFFGFKTYPLDQYGDLVGGNLETIFSKLLDDTNRTDENISKLRDKYREVYSLDPKPNTKPFHGIIDILKYLNKENISIAINTNKAQSLTEELCNLHFKDIEFSGIFGYKAERPSKPDPYAANELIRINDVSTNNTIYVGDGLTDIMTAKNAGIDFILASWGQGDVKKLSEKMNSSFIARSAEDILKFL